jgi:hypothetical protein
MMKQPVGKPMTDQSAYTIGEHRHRFATWAAARAAGRGAGGWKASLVGEAILSAGNLRQVADTIDNLPAPEQFPAAHAAWCKAIERALKSQGAEKVNYGRAAKVVAIYLKAVSAGHDPAANEKLRAVYPPVDAILLASLPKAQRDRLRGLPRWTSFMECHHDKVISVLRDLAGKGGLWTVERFWNPDIRSPGPKQDGSPSGIAPIPSGR